MFFPGRGSIPANLPHILYWPTTHNGGAVAPAPPPAGDLRFVRLEAAGPVDVPYSVEADSTATQPRSPAYRVVPSSPLRVGARYALWARTCSEPIAEDPPEEPDGADDLGTQMPRARFAVFDVTAAAPPPSTLGAVTLSAPQRESLRLLDTRGGCGATRNVVAVDAVSTALSNPWVDAIAFSTYVDGERYVGSDNLAYGPAYGSSWVGHGRDKLVALCDAREEDAVLLAPGTHTVQFRGRIPGSEAALLSDEATFELASCDTPNTASGGAKNDGDGSCSLARTTSGRGGSIAALLALALYGSRRRAERSPALS